MLFLCLMHSIWFDPNIRRRKETMKSKPLFILLLICFVPAYGHAWTDADSQELIRKMEASYAEVRDYQTHLVITGFGKDSSFVKTQKLVYTFKKPNKIRLDFESPHEGMIVLYPDDEGKVLVRPSGWASAFTLHLDAKSSLLEISPGQQINQTDLGILIRNIAHSITDFYLGDLQVSSDSEEIIVRMLSDNPFHRGTPTRYAFFIDTRLWLPVKVQEYTPSGKLERRVIYEKLKLNTGISDSIFSPN